MKTIKVSEAEGAVLDWLVAKCEGYKTRSDEKYGLMVFLPSTHPNVVNWCAPHELGFSSNPAQAWPIIDRELICLDAGDGLYPPKRKWSAWLASSTPLHVQDEITGPTSLIAAMRCYVVSRLGHTVEVPEELVS